MPFEQLRDCFRDVAFTTTTAFDSAGHVNYDAIGENLASLYDAGARLFVPCGNTGEYYALTQDERANIVETTVDAVDSDATVVGGVGGSTGTALELIDRYEAVGADAIMVMHPDHTHIHERGLSTYYRKLAGATDLGIVPYKRGPELSKEVLEEVTEVENVVAVKYAGSDIHQFSQTVSDCSNEVVWVNGSAERYAPALALEGAEGFTTGIGNFVPNLTLTLYEAIESEDWQRARQIRDLLRPYENLRDEAGTNNSLPSANNVPAVKYGMDLANQYGGPVREPLTELCDADKDRAERYFDQMCGDPIVSNVGNA